MIYFISTVGTVILVGFSDFYPKLRKAGSWMSILVLSMLAGWRNMGGKDFFVYQNVYYGVIPAYFTDEKGYIWLNNLFSGLGLSYNIFLFFYSFVAIALLVWFLHKHTKYSSFALLFYIACYFFFYNLVLNRQMLCMSFALWAIYQWNNNKWCSFGIIALGMMFHNSIFVIVPFLLIFEVLNHTKGCIGWYCFFGVLLLFTSFVEPMRAVELVGQIPGLSFISTRLQGYFQRGEVSAYTLNSIEYLKMGFGLGIILPYLRQIMQDKTNRVWVFLYFVGLVMLIWTRNIEILFRIFVYFDLSLLVLLSICLDFFLKSFSGQQREIALISTYGFMGCLSLFSILYRVYHFDNGAFFYNYHFYFMG